MNYTHKKASYFLAGLLAVSIATPAFAITNDTRERDAGLGVKANVNLKVNDKSISVGTDTEIQTKASAAIDRRIQDLQSLQTRINAMKRISETTKTSIAANITTEISRLTVLRSKINSETGDALKADAKTIGGSYRIYMMVIPQTRILAAADRAQAVADMMSELAVKLEARIVAAEATGAVMTNERAALADMKLKITDAKIQAKAASDLVSGLVPDEKDKTKMATNEKAIVAARSKLKIAHEDLKAAHVNAKSIIGEVKKYGVRNKDNEKREDSSKDNTTD